MNGLVATDSVIIAYVFDYTQEQINSLSGSRASRYCAIKQFSTRQTRKSTQLVITLCSKCTGGETELGGNFTPSLWVSEIKNLKRKEMNIKQLFTRISI